MVALRSVARGETMYLPRHFEETDRARLHAAIRAHPLGTLIVLTPEGLCANHVPFVVHPELGANGTLRGHVARANTVWRDFAPDVQALAVFHGPQAYVSPSWYATKRESAKVVPTWNYIAVHAHGPLRAVEDRAWLRSQIERLTSEHEQAPQPWRVDDAPADYVEHLLGAIVGLELAIERLVGKWKLSQNRPARDREGVAAGLIAEGSDEAAALANALREASASARAASPRRA
jgi:transcriptional regulator